MTRMLTALGAVVVLLAASAQAAFAKQVVAAQGGPPAPGPVQESSASASATGNRSTATATATCPSGTKSAGGGFNAPSTADSIALVYESVKVDKRSWRASAQLLDLSGSGTLNLTTYVYCRTHVPNTKTVSTTVPTNGQVHVGPTAEASCPDGQVAAAGGFRIPAPLVAPTVTALFFDSIRSGTSAWDSRVVTGPAGPSSLTSEVYCARRGAAPAEATGSSAPNGQDSTSSTGVAACPTGLSPAAGGFAQPDSSPISFYFVYESRRVGDTWQVSALHSGGPQAVAVDVAGYCA